MLTITGALADEKWLNTAADMDGEMASSVRVGSFTVAKNQGGEPIAVVIGRIVNKKTSRIDLQKWYVRLADCAAGQGKLVTLSISGQFRYDNDFVFDGGTISSTNAKFICDTYNYIEQQSRKKSM